MQPPSIRELVSKIELHQHLCPIHTTREEQFSAAIPFLKIGLEHGERCIYVAETTNTAAMLATAMRAQGIDAEDAIRQGSLSITNPSIYTAKDGFDPDTMIRIWSERTGGCEIRRVLGPKSGERHELGGAD